MGPHSGTVTFIETAPAWTLVTKMKQIVSITSLELQKMTS